MSGPGDTHSKVEARAHISVAARQIYALGIMKYARDQNLRREKAFARALASDLPRQQCVCVIIMVIWSGP